MSKFLLLLHAWDAMGKEYEKSSVYILKTGMIFKESPPGDVSWVLCHAEPIRKRVGGVCRKGEPKASEVRFTENFSDLEEMYFFWYFYFSSQLR